ncbi:hypothetical protein [Thalassobacillus hwangdonensis]|uniref:DUF5640 domain-containing protein n=1 Tax=Thalassobacillus hwangdonensis TaxID=546108 RepID=A0ABW3L5Z7_9BACI
MIFKRSLLLLLLVLMGCENEETEPMMFKGENENWKTALVMEQEEEGHVRYKVNITYKKDDEPYIQKWVDGQEVDLDFYIKGLRKKPKMYHTSMFYGSEGHWVTFVDNQSVAEPFNREDAFVLTLRLDDNEEEVTLRFDEDGTEDLEEIDGDVIGNSLKEPLDEEKG